MLSDSSMSERVDRCRTKRLNVVKYSPLLSPSNSNSSTSYCVSPSPSPSESVHARAPSPNSASEDSIIKGPIRKISVKKSYGKPRQRVPSAKNFFGIVNDYEPHEIKEILLRTFKGIPEFFLVKLIQSSFKDAIMAAPVDYLSDGIEPDGVSESGSEQRYVYFFFKTKEIQTLDSIYLALKEKFDRECRFFIAIIRNVTQTILHLAKMSPSAYANEDGYERQLIRRYHPILPEELFIEKQPKKDIYSFTRSQRFFVEKQKTLYENFIIPIATEFTTSFMYDNLSLQPLNKSQRMAVRAFNLALSLPKSDKRRNILFIGEPGSGKTTLLNAVLLQNIPNDVIFRPVMYNEFIFDTLCTDFHKILICDNVTNETLFPVTQVAVLLDRQSEMRIVRKRLIDEKIHPQKLINVFVVDSDDVDLITKSPVYEKFGFVIEFSPLKSNEPLLRKFYFNKWVFRHNYEHLNFVSYDANSIELEILNPETTQYINAPRF